ncbi:MAG: CocE/NonD family hydrolase [Actinomycetota bacterium]
MRIVVEKGVAVPMRDGVELLADLYLPEGRGPFPALLHRVPYSREAPRIVNFSLDAHRSVQAGYAVVVQDVRGRFGSGGTFTPFLDDGADGADTIDWIVAQPWSSGKVGMAGGSYAGATQWAAARARPAGLTAIAPFVATNDCYDGWIYRRGVFELGFNVLWSLRNIGPANAVRAGADLAPLVEAADAIDEVYRHVPLAGQAALDGLTPYYDDWLQEPVPNGRWGGLHDAAGADVDANVLSIGGWFDVFQPGSLAGYASKGGGTRRLVMGPWAHAVFGGEYAARSFGVAADTATVNLTALHLRWYDRWVKGEENGAEHDAPVRLFVMGADYWRDEDGWPPSDAVETSLFLRGNGGLTRQAPADEPADEFEYDPNDPAPTVGGTTFLPGLHLAANSGPRDQAPLAARRDVLSWTGDALDAPLEIVGPVSLVLHVSSDAPDADFAATLADVAPDGTALNVADGIVRARYRDGRASSSLLSPGTVYELLVELGGTAHVFRPGHRPRVLVTGGSFPRYERNPQTGELPAEATELRAARHRVHHDARHPSQLVVHVVERDETLERIA